MKKVVVLHFVNNVYLGYFLCRNTAWIRTIEKVDPAYLFKIDQKNCLDPRIDF